MADASVHGLEGLSIGALATRLGVSKSGLFAHFQSKQNLQIEVLQASVESFIQTVVAPALKKPRGTPRVRALFDIAYHNQGATTLAKDVAKLSCCAG